MQLDIYWKITFTTLIIGGITLLVGIMVDAFLGFYTKWEQVIALGMGTILLGLVETALLSALSIWQM